MPGPYPLWLDGAMPTASDTGSRYAVGAQGPAPLHLSGAGGTMRIWYLRRRALRPYTWITLASPFLRAGRGRPGEAYHPCRGPAWLCLDPLRLDGAMCTASDAGSLMRGRGAACCAPTALLYLRLVDDRWCDGAR